MGQQVGGEGIVGTYYTFICEPLLGARSYSRHKGAAEYDGSACSGRADFLVEGADSENQPGVFVSLLVGSVVSRS